VVVVAEEKKGKEGKDEEEKGKEEEEEEVAGCRADVPQRSPLVPDRWGACRAPESVRSGLLRFDGRWLATTAA